MKFFPIFAVRVTHSYYVDGRCPDFLIVPNLETERLLRNHRCVVKSLPDGIRVLTPVDEEGKPFIAFPDEMTFTFHLRLQNPDFTLFTDLSDINNRHAPLYTNAGLNSGNSKELRLASRTAWHTESFVVVQPAPEDRFTLRGRPLAGLKLTTFKVEGSGKVTLQEYDESDNVIAVDSGSAREGEMFAVKYPIEPRLDRGVFADVDIHNNDTLQPIGEKPVDFHVAFSAKQARWKYYFITDLKSTADQFFQIIDADPSPTVPALALVFSDENRKDLNQDPDPSDDLAKELAEQYPGMQRFRFVSDNLIPCQQAARKHLELRLDGNPLCGILPNPSFRNYSKIEQQDSLFHVVKYLTNPFP